MQVSSTEATVLAGLVERSRGRSRPFKTLAIEELIQVANLVSDHLGEPRVNFGEPSEDKREELTKGTIYALDQINMFVARKDGELVLIPQSQTRVDPMCAAEITVVQPGESSETDESTTEKVVSIASKRGKKANGAKPKRDELCATLLIEDERKAKATNPDKPTRKGLVADETVIKATDKPTSGLTQKRVELAKDGITVAEWRKQAIAAGLAPKADPNCIALLSHLIRQGFISTK